MGAAGGRLAYVFPGQGSQRLGMGKDWAEEFETASEVFAEADEVLGFPLSRLCWDGPERDLQLTINTQPAVNYLKKVTCHEVEH